MCLQKKPREHYSCRRIEHSTKAAATLQGNVQSYNQESLGSLSMLGHWLWYAGIIFQNHMAWSQALLGLPSWEVIQKQQKEYETFQ